MKSTLVKGRSIYCSEKGTVGPGHKACTGWRSSRRSDGTIIEGKSEPCGCPCGHKKKGDASGREA